MQIHSSKTKKRIYDREYQRRKRAENPGYKTLEYRRYCKNNPEKVKAHGKVSYALRKGTLKKEPCADCGEEKVHGHHEDYSLPLIVKWLCPVHHKAIH